MALHGSRGNNVFDDKAVEVLSQQVFNQQREISGLRHRLATFGMRRHQGGYIPAVSKITTATTGSVSVTTTTETQHDFTSVVGDDFTLDSGILTATKAGVFTAFLRVGSVSVDFVRNGDCDLQWHLKKRTGSSGPWSVVVTGRRKTWYPDVAIGAVSENEYNEHASGPILVAVGNQFRVTTEYAFTTGIPAAISGTITAVFRS